MNDLDYIDALCAFNIKHDISCNWKTTNVRIQFRPRNAEIWTLSVCGCRIINCLDHPIRNRFTLALFVKIRQIA